ncbi:MAG: hypothetical protein MI924_39505 [Chloroflexales bacterium]|nr:hypothetical protein [Chloroflexales bacterium]
MGTKQVDQNTEQTVKLDAMPCGYIATKRQRYFTGKYMSAQDFADEQRYHLSRHRLHNRILHGWGVVCGLRVKRHPNPDCKHWAVVRAGIAIDCCGRELILHQDTAIDLSEYFPEPPAAAAQQQSQPEERPQDNWLVLGLRYVERPIESVPVLYNETACDPTQHEYNRVYEVAELKVYELRDFADYPNEWPGTVWRKQYNGKPANEEEKERPCRGCRDDCDDELPGPTGICLEPECLLDHIVPLAIIKPIWSGEEGWSWEADSNGRRTMRMPPEFLTHIVHHNWPHGQSLPLSELVSFDKMDGKLKIYFDRPLADKPQGKPQQTSDQADQEQPSSGDQGNDLEYAGTGINRSTFVVHIHKSKGIRLEADMLYDDNNPPYWDPQECAAIFPVHEEWLEGSDTLVDHIVHVTLKCDFVLDCHDLAVDGNHLGGVAPTGDGIAGGTFESWFRVVDDGANARALRREAARKREEQIQSAEKS